VLNLWPPVSAEGACESDKLSHSHVAVEALVLAHVGDTAANLDALFAIVIAMAEDGARARSRVDHAKQHLDRRTLARTIAAQKAGDALSSDG
jgi:hypothetical protein